jgi:hypothetical protein
MPAVVMGNTVKVKLIFRNWDGYHEDPSEIFYTIYNVNKNIYKGYRDVEVSPEEHRYGLGEYHFYFTVPDGDEKVILEVKAKLNGEWLLERLVLDREFITDRAWDEQCPEVDFVAIPGNTIRLTCKYYGFEDTSVLKEVDSPKLVIYDEYRYEIFSTELSTGNKLSTGHYEYKYYVPNGNTNLIAEFSGNIDGRDITARRELERVWAENIDLHDYKE